MAFGNGVIMKKKYNDDIINKHLTIDEREFIEQCLLNYDGKNINFKIIADSLAKDPSTISKEIRRHRTLVKASKYNNLNYNLCKNKFNCKKRNICNTGCKYICRECEYCNSHCKDFVKIVCNKLSKPPYVCNGCSSRNKCMYEKYIYRAKEAQKNYSNLLHECRKGLNLTYSEYQNYENAIKNGITKGQSIYHIKNSTSFIPYDVSTIYRHIETGVIDIKNIDLIRKVKLKPRKQTALERKQAKLKCIGRTYQDFLKYKEKHPFVSVVEMDTVIGKRDEDPVILTFLHRDSHLFLAFLVENKTSGMVNNKIEEVYQLIGKDNFKGIAPIILTDNGSEFAYPEEIEYTIDGEERCKLFYCDPMNSGQKGMLEETHTLLRRVLPKGTSFIGLTQNQVTLNSYIRKSINGCTPIKRAKLIIKKEVLEKLNLVEIPAKQVNLKPNLIK